jgi:hypothetical protein
VLAAGAEFEIDTVLPLPLERDSDEFAYAVTVERNERIDRKDSAFPCRRRGNSPQFNAVKARIGDTARMVAEEKRDSVPYRVGTMIELPRAALMAGEIARTAEFFSFGTNDGEARRHRMPRLAISARFAPYRRAGRASSRLLHGRTLSFVCASPRS